MEHWSAMSERQSITVRRRLRIGGQVLCAALLGAAMAGCGSDGAKAPEAGSPGGNPPGEPLPPGIARTSAGLVRGDVGEIVSFKGIPYARPPVGDLRWRPPADAEPWEGVRDALAFGPACIQAGSRVQSEDCLTLNVWVPRESLDRGEKLPVLVWVYGGSFVGGSGDFEAEGLARKGAVVVSMNYRVSTMGFMAHPGLSAESPEGTSGNYGLLDIAQSLKWVRKNIANFGGDAGRVTVWGQSSGASAITALMVSPRSDGLFDQVILDSPGAMRHWKTLAEAEQDGIAIGSDIGQLRKLPADQVPVIQNTGGGTAVRALAEPRVIGPVLDGVVLPLEERPAFERGQARAVPVLVGYNTDEGASFTGGYQIRTVDAYRAYLKDPKIFAEFGDEAFSYYPVSSDSEVQRAISDSFGDNQFVFGTRGIARAMAAQGQPVYRYWFRRKGNGGTGADAVHGAELPYVRADARLDAAPYTADDVKLSRMMNDAWFRFVSTGDPNGGEVTNWPRYDTRSEPVYVFDAATEIVNGPRNDRLDFIGRVDAALNPVP
ncbi:carboxylesterase family protein [Pigmentiphaga sp. GD03639]|uniref:carboxylesterase/lipase family protein n=2 Tax=Pigmentiphaga TaxID=152267 RepID=UPI00244C32C3|nr:carboxylesterase family protein [Pigmentiphaga sp. GD03639]MDH2240076.1 carboxylesterase family protein [Pigmentiphaga sp. GD03639]